MSAQQNEPEIFKIWKEQAQKNPRRVLLPEPLDPRILTAAIRAQKSKVAHPILLGEAESIHQLAESLGFSAAEVPEILPAVDGPHFQQLCQDYAERRAQAGRPPNVKSAQRLLSQPVYRAAMMLSEKQVDAVVAGAITTTADVLRAALHIVGVAPGVTYASSAFIMAGLNPELGYNGSFIFADCAANIAPTPPQLAAIATLSAQTARRLLQTDPRVALLSFSTHGSANHEKVENVAEAVKVLREQNPDFMFDGELQVDAAVIPEIAQKKAPQSPLKGRANVLIFPDLNSGNIGYKLMERLGNARAVGVILQGLKRPMCDLSRGAKTEDIEQVITLMTIVANIESELQ